ncbi:Biopolymer transport protein ExbD/TolR [Planctomycetes bacterium Poly30]|uniref:Biopolymer transport protein ExbD/TolR n=1 Tax=Saltatorellus ferox TaxID=2528018 RepID=A0A518EVG4_9BACT|nr:Biopolymer transport protein ExbD/TolR [Planctomycetes bacterium Poly30]
MTSSNAEPSSGPGQAALTPLLDTLFLLLFAVLASSDGKAAREDATQEIQVELPSVEDDGTAEASASDVAPIVVTIDADGAVTVGEAAFSVAEPGDLGAALAGFDPVASVEIRAHADARHAVVVEVLHELRQAGRLDVRFVATRREVEAPRAARQERSGR